MYNFEKSVKSMNECRLSQRTSAFRVTAMVEANISYCRSSQATVESQERLSCDPQAADGSGL